MGQNKKVYFIGKINVDIFGNTLNEALENTKDDGQIGVTIGGAAFNVHRAFETLSRVYDDHYDTEIITNMGVSPVAEDFASYEEGLLVETSNAIYVPKLMEHYGVSYHDILAGVDGPGAAVSVVEGFSGGRHITKQIQPLLRKFNEASGVNYCDEFGKKLVGSSLVFIDPARPEFAAHAAHTCKGLKIPFVTDYGMKKWPQGPAGEHALDVLRMAWAKFFPSDAVLREMQPGEENLEQLFSLLTESDIYKEKVRGPGGKKVITVSDGIKPVWFHHGFVGAKGDDYKVNPTKITVEVVGNPINVNGIGDTRDGAYMFFSMRGDDPETAVRKATKVASIRVQYPEGEWEKHFLDHVRYDPLFESDIPDLEKAIESQIESKHLAVNEEVKDQEVSPG